MPTAEELNPGVQVDCARARSGFPSQRWYSTTLTTEHYSKNMLIGSKFCAVGLCLIIT